MNTKFQKPVYITCDCSDRFKVQDKKDRFISKVTYIWRDQLIEVKIQDNGKLFDDEMFGEWFLN